MRTEPHTPATYDLGELAARHPDLAAMSPATDEAELKRLETKYRILLQLAEQSLRDRELRLKEGAAKVDRWANPLMVGVLAGALGLLGSVVNGIVANRNQRAQLDNQSQAERIKLQNDLIKEAIKPADEQERAKSLVFFATNGLISLDSSTLASLVRIAGSARPVPGSSGGVPALGELAIKSARPIEFRQAIVDRILAAPGVPYPADVRPTAHPGDTTRKAIILHDAILGDGSVGVLREGNGTIPGPLAHWVVQSNGYISFVVGETVKANHVGRGDRGVSNFNSIAISVTGDGALSDDRQTENLVRLVADVADRWGIPTEMILSHAEVSLPKGRKVDMEQQAPVLRQMVDAVRKRR
jgi:hypothetical protein